MSEKPKRQYSLPNRQLARVFRFTAEDLAANRAGYMTWAQEQTIVLWQRKMFGWLSPFLRLFRPKRQKPIAHICGKVRLKFKIKEYHAQRQVAIYDSYQLTIPETGVVLPLTQKQYQLLSDNATYHIYMPLDMGRILSLEQAISGCDET